MTLIVQFFEFPQARAVLRSITACPALTRLSGNMFLYASYAYDAWLKASKVTWLRSVTWLIDPSGNPTWAHLVLTFTMSWAMLIACFVFLATRATDGQDFVSLTEKIASPYASAQQASSHFQLWGKHCKFDLRWVHIVWNGYTKADEVISPLKPHVTKNGSWTSRKS